MLLAVDVGNTQTQIGIFQADLLVAEWRIATQSRRTADDNALLFKEFLAFQDLSFSRQVTGVAIASVVPPLTASLREMVTRYFHFDPVVVEPGIRTGMPVLTENPREVGADRIANAVAAFALVGGPAVVIDFGTATTFDAVSARGEYVGGVIAPGIEISVEALGVKAAQLRKIELNRPRNVIGKNTVEAMQSGILYGFAGQVDGLVHRMAKELSEDPDDVTVIATGGLAPLVLADSAVIDEHEPWLTLIGLRLVYERNVSRS